MPKKIIFLSIIAIIFLGVAAYSNSFKNDFVWDDESLIVNNELIRDISNWQMVVTQELLSGSHTNYYRPVQVFSYMLDYRIWELNPFGYHLTNFLLHILNAILVYLLLMNIMLEARGYRLQAKSLQLGACSLERNYIPFLTALFWVVHPVHVEAVSYISGRADLLAAFFMLSAMLLYIRSFSRPRLATRYLLLATLLFILALFSKEISIMLPAALISYEYFFRKEQRLSFRIKRITPFIVIAIFYISLRQTVVNFSSLSIWLNQAISPRNIHNLGMVRFFNFFKGSLLYVRLLIMPVNLHMERYIIPATSLFNPYVLAFIAITAVFILAFKKFSFISKHIVLFGIAWFFIFLFPQSNFIFIWLTAEHFLYLPSIGIFLITAIGFHSFYKRKEVLAVLLAAIIVLFLGITTFAQNYIWRDNFTFYRWMDEYAQASYLARNNLANIYAYLGKDDLAIAKYEQALGINYRTKIRDHRIETIEENRKLLFDNLEKKYRDTLKAQPFSAVPYYNLAYLYERKGRFSEAIPYYEKAIELKPKFAEAISNLGNVYERQGRFEEALSQYKQAVSVNPRFAQGYFNIGVVLANQGKLKEAEEYFTKTLEIEPGYQKAKDYLKIIRK